MTTTTSDSKMMSISTSLGAVHIQPVVTLGDADRLPVYGRSTISHKLNQAKDKVKSAKTKVKAAKEKLQEKTLQELQPTDTEYDLARGHRDTAQEALEKTREELEEAQDQVQEMQDEIDAENFRGAVHDIEPVVTLGDRLPVYGRTISPINPDARCKLATLTSSPSERSGNGHHFRI